MSEVSLPLGVNPQYVILIDPDGNPLDVGSDGSITITGQLAELPTAALLANNTPMPTTTIIGSALMAYDGANLDVLPGNSVAGLKIDLGTDNDVTIGSTGSAGNTTIAAGNTAQDLFSGATPTNGFALVNNEPSEEMWFRDDGGTATVGGADSERLAPYERFETPPGYKPAGKVSVIAATTGHKIIARKW